VGGAWGDSPFVINNGEFGFGEKGIEHLNDGVAFRRVLYFIHTTMETATKKEHDGSVTAPQEPQTIVFR
jgi:hypothetical protein